MIKIQNSENFDEIIKTKTKLIIEFYAEWCEPCKRAHMISKKLAIENKNEIFFYFFDLDEDEDDFISLKFDVKIIPAFFVFKNGVFVKRAEGCKENLIKSLVNLLK